MNLGQQITLKGFKRVQILHGDTLQRLAARELGDATQWATIAAINKLAPPYLTGDPAVAGPGILLYGNTLMIPSVNSEPEPGKTSTEDVFLSDILLVDGRLTVVDGDLKKVAGRANLAQALSIRIETAPGELVFHCKYGCRVHEQKGKKNTAVAALLGSLYVKEAVLSDHRIAKITQSRTDIVGDVIGVEVEARTITSHPFDINLSV